MGSVIYCMDYIQAALTIFLTKRDIICLQQVPFGWNGYSSFIKTDFFLTFLVFKWLSEVCVMHSTWSTCQEEIEVRCPPPLLSFY